MVNLLLTAEESPRGESRQGRIGQRKRGCFQAAVAAQGRASGGAVPGVLPKLIERYAKRAAVEEPFELRRHAGSLKATLMAAFLRRRPRRSARSKSSDNMHAL